MLLPILSMLLSLSAMGLAVFAIFQPSPSDADSKRLSTELELLDARFESVWAELEKKANSRAARKPKDADATVSEDN